MLSCLFRSRLKKLPCINSFKLQKGKGHVVHNVGDGDIHIVERNLGDGEPGIAEE